MKKVYNLGVWIIMIYVCIGDDTCAMRRILFHIHTEKRERKAASEFIHTKSG